MPKYRKKPVIVEAEVYRPGMEDGFSNNCCSECGIIKKEECINGYIICEDRNIQKPYINTLKGKHYVSPGDYIITGVEGERYPIKPHIFEMTYEKVEG